MTRTMREVKVGAGPGGRAARRLGALWAAFAGALALLLSPAAAFAQAPAPPRFDAGGKAAGEPLSERVVAYEIDATLDAKEGTVKGRETLTWVNKSQAPQSTLWFHLYWNAFKNERSTFYRDSKLLGFRDESSSAEDYPDRKDDEWGYSDITAIGVRGGVDLKPGLRFQHPDDDNEHDQTVFTVDLPAPVAPGASVTLEIAWSSKVPKIVARAGRKGDYYFFGQWFPKIGVLEVPPSRGTTEPRWNCHQYHSSTEYYADWGTYDVRMTVPKEFVLGASGVRVGKAENPDGTVTYHHHQDDVHDFAWTAWPGFEQRDEVFRAPGLPEVAVTVLTPKGHDRGARQSFESIKASLEHYGRWWYPWPYPHLTIVSPPRGAGASGGMEYPTLITTGATSDPVEPKDYALWAVTAHEFGHNYWYGIMASNEFEESWLDEGINSYGTQKLLDAEGVTFRPVEFLLPSGLRPLLASSVPLEFNETQLAEARSRPSWDSPVITPGWKFRGWGDYGMSSYTRPQMNLLVLEKLLGEKKVGEIMRAYVDRFKFKHPRSEDFFGVANDVSGQNLDWYFDQAFRSTAGLDVKVSDVACSDATAEYDVGAFDDGKGGKTIKNRSDERERQKKAEKAGEKPTRRCRVTLEKEGSMAVPVSLRITLEDGTQKAETWDGRGAYKHFFFVGQGRGSDVARVEVEPEARLVFDAGRANDSHTTQADGRVAARLFGWLSYVTQLVLGLLPSLTLRKATPMNTTLGQALAALRRAAGDVKLVALLLLANALPSLAFAFAPSSAAYGALGHSLVGRSEPFLGGDLAAELIRVATKGAGGVSWLALFSLAVLASLPLQIALSGGVAARALEGQAPFSSADFVADCVRLFGRNVRLFGWALLGFVPVAVVAAIASALVGKLEDPLGEKSMFLYKALRFAVVALAFAAWRLAFDAAKVQAVSAEPRAMRRAAWHGLKAAFSARRLFLGYVGLGLAGALGVLVLMRVHAALPVGSTLGALFALAFAQVVLAFRLAFSVAATNYVAAASATAGPKKLEGGRRASVGAMVCKIAPLLKLRALARATRPENALGFGGLLGERRPLLPRAGASVYCAPPLEGQPPHIGAPGKVFVFAGGRRLSVGGTRPGARGAADSKR